jgi:hypothetical protein
MSAIGNWSFNHLATSFPGAILPNIQFWNVTNGTWEYQVQIAYPLNWTSTSERSTVDTMEVPSSSIILRNFILAHAKLSPTTLPGTVILEINLTDLEKGMFSMEMHWD